MIRTRCAALGFTVLEMIIVMVILGIVAATVVSMVAQFVGGREPNRQMQVGAQLLQECGELIVSNHRRDKTWYNVSLGTGSASCYGMAALTLPDGSAYSPPVVTVADHTGGSGCPVSPPAPASATSCKLVTITISKSSTSINSVRMILVGYNPI